MPTESSVVCCVCWLQVVLRGGLVAPWDAVPPLVAQLTDELPETRTAALKVSNTCAATASPGHYWTLCYIYGVQAFVGSHACALQGLTNAAAGSVTSSAARMDLHQGMLHHHLNVPPVSVSVEPVSLCECHHGTVLSRPTAYPDVGVCCCPRCRC